MSEFNNISSFVNGNDEKVHPMDEDLDIEEQQQQTTFDISELNIAVKKASEDALTSKTVTTYQRSGHLLLSIKLIFQFMEGL
jgi:hypothetical protein